MKKTTKKLLRTLENEVAVNSEILEAVGSDLDRLYHATDPWNDTPLVERVEELEECVAMLTNLVVDSARAAKDECEPLKLRPWWSVFSL